MHNELDILNGQVNEHTSDLGGLGANDLLNELVENRANLVLIVGVLGHDGVDDGVAIHQVALIDAHLLMLHHHLLLLHHHLLLLLILLGHLLLGNWVRTACYHLHLTRMPAVAAPATSVVSAVVGPPSASGVTTPLVALFGCLLRLGISVIPRRHFVLLGSILCLFILLGKFSLLTPEFHILRHVESCFALSIYVTIENS